MAEDLYAKPDLSKKLRFQPGEKGDSNADVGHDIDSVKIYGNYWAEGSTPPNSQDSTTDDQQHRIDPSDRECVSCPTHI